MTDRELIAAAAKAAGYDVRWHEPWDCFVHNGPFNIDNPPTLAGQRMVWLPLTDDGDALRLAVKLHLCVKVYTDAVIVGNDHTVNGKEMVHETKGDPAAATRRAITRAAAELVKATP